VEISGVSGWDLTGKQDLFLWSRKKKSLLMSTGDQERSMGNCMGSTMYVMVCGN